MFPGMPKMDPKQMSKIMAQMGIKSEELDVSKVTIEKADGSKIVVEPASVTKIIMQGQATFQVAGVAVEEGPGAEGAGEKSDADLVAEQTGVSRDEAEKALKDADGDIAQAILHIEQGKG